MTASEPDTRKLQALVTFGLGGVVAVLLWPRLEAVSRWLIVLFAVLAGISIYNGTWLQDSRVLRREAAENRREAIRLGKSLMKSKSS
jgi:hypothetical protein